MSRYNFNIGDRIKFKNLPVTHPRATIIEVSERFVKCRLDDTVTEMGYAQEDVQIGENSPIHKPRLKKDLVVFNFGDIEIL